NFSSGHCQRILDRFPGVLVFAVYPVPHPRTGDQVMAASQLESGVAFDPVAFSEFCRAQPDMGTKWAPRFVRVLEDMPVTATRKISKPRPRRETGTAPGDIYPRGGGGADPPRPATSTCAGTTAGAGRSPTTTVTPASRSTACTGGSRPGREDSAGRSQRSTLIWNG